MPRIAISHYSFQIPTPYCSGHILTESEAKALNWFQMDSVRNTVLRRLSKLPPNYILTPQELVEYQTWINQLYSDFKFKTKNPYERRALLDIEREAVAREFLSRAGQKSSPFMTSTEIFNALEVGKILEVEIEARRRIQARLAVISPQTLGVE